MIKTEEAYKDLEASVGPENISIEPVVLDGYAWQPFANTEKWVPRPVAVVLPACTEEVQAVVKACNKHGLKFKPFSTGWGMWAGCGEENVVQIDLRRMNRIIEIDAKNMRAVIEPYVCGAQLQAETWKVGLNTNIVGAGPNCSPLAGATSMVGLGHSGIYMSFSGRNVLGMEWVTPEGEIVRIGSLGSGLDMFVGDGPGPSLRGVVRGCIGAAGGLGIFTKCSLKLYNWPGPPQIKADGLVINSSVKETPDNLVAYSCFFPNAEKICDAMHMISEAEIGYNAVRTTWTGAMICFMPHLFDKIMATSAMKSLITESLRYYYSVVLAGTSKGDLEYQEKVLREIVLACDGFCLKQKDSPAMEELFLLNTIKGTTPALAFRRAGCFFTTMSRNDTIDLQVKWTDFVADEKERLVEENKIMDDAGDTAYCLAFENGTWAHSEQTYQYDPRNEEQVKQVKNIGMLFVARGAEMNMEPQAAMEKPSRTLLSPLCDNYNEYQKNISKMMDPNQSADTTFYTKEEAIDWAGLPDGLRLLIKELQQRYTWKEDGPSKL